MHARGKLDEGNPVEPCNVIYVYMCFGTYRDNIIRTCATSVIVNYPVNQWCAKFYEPRPMNLFFETTYVQDEFRAKGKKILKCKPIKIKTMQFQSLQFITLKTEINMDRSRNNLNEISVGTQMLFC